MCELQLFSAVIFDGARYYYYW